MKEFLLVESVLTRNNRLSYGCAVSMGPDTTSRSRDDTAHTGRGKVKDTEKVK